MNKNKKNIALTALLSVLTLATSCASASDILQTSGTTESITLTAGALTAEYKNKDLDTSYDSTATTINCGTTNTINGNGVSEKDGVITISTAGTYVLSGSYTGKVVIEAAETDYVHLILNGFSITSTDGSAIYAKSCDKLTITLADNTENSIIDSSNYTFAENEDEPDAALFSDADMSINGNGALIVTGNYADAIKCKNDLKLISGTYNITAVGEGIKGRNSVVVKDGTYNITSGETAIKATKDTDPLKGYVIVDGGSITINAGNDGIHAETHLTLNGGTINVEKSNEGLEGQMIDITGGTINVTASDDGINASRIGSTSSKGGGMGNGRGFGSSDDGTLPNDRQNITPPDGMQGGNQNMTPPNANQQGGNQSMTPPNGNQQVGGRGFKGNRGDMQSQQNSDNNNTAITDALLTMPVISGNGSVADKDGNILNTGGHGNGGMGGGMGMQSSNDGQVYIDISGGVITVSGGADCIDANGSITISGGEIYASSPRYGITGPEAVLDADGSITFKSGATFIATGNSSSISLTNEQNSIYVYEESSIAAGTAISLKDSSGITIASYTATSSFSGIAITAPEIEIGKTYTLSVGDTSQQISVTDKETSIGTASASTGMGGGRGDMGMKPNINSTTETTN